MKQELRKYENPPCLRQDHGKKVKLSKKIRKNVKTHLVEGKIRKKSQIVQKILLKRIRKSGKKPTLSRAGSGGAFPCFLNKHNPVQGFTVVTDELPCIFLTIREKILFFSTSEISTLAGKAPHILG